MARTICRIFGVAFVLAGLGGFAMPHLLGFHLTPIHSVVHIATGALALYLGFAGSARAVRTFCIVFGAVYLALGALGFVAPDVVAAVIGHPLVDRNELMPDNVFHIVVGAVFLLAGLTGPRAVPVGRVA
jgi:uncharacterized protein DUF4383